MKPMQTHIEFMETSDSKRRIAGREKEERLINEREFTTELSGWDPSVAGFRFLRFQIGTSLR
jgi:hypothetical protein